MDLRSFKEMSMTKHDALMPGFAKTNTARLVSRMQAVKYLELYVKTWE